MLNTAAVIVAVASRIVKMLMGGVRTHFAQIAAAVCGDNGVANNARGGGAVAAPRGGKETPVCD